MNALVRPDVAFVRGARPRAMVQYATDGGCLCTEDHFLYRYEYADGSRHRLCRIPTPGVALKMRIKDMLARSLPARMIRRYTGLSNAAPLPEGGAIITYDKLYRWPGFGKFAEPVVRFSSVDFFPPLKGGIAVDEERRAAYFGEYQNQRPYAAKIMRVTEAGRKYEICHQFAAGEVKHIHSVRWDRFRKRLWICTGDTDSESGLYYTDDDFGTVNRFGGGDQSWRMVSLVPTRRYLYWGSDAGKDAPAHAVNYIYRWDFKLGKRERLVCIDNPAYYSAATRDGRIVIGTAFEPGMRRSVTQSADLWVSDNREAWVKVVSLPYRRQRAKRGTAYGVVNLPTGELPSGRVVFSPVNVSRYDFNLVDLQLLGGALER